MSFTNLNEIIDLAEKQQTKIATFMIEKEVKQTGMTKEAIIKKMLDQFDIME